MDIAVVTDPKDLGAYEYRGVSPYALVLGLGRFNSALFAVPSASIEHGRQHKVMDGHFTDNLDLGRAVNGKVVAGPEFHLVGDKVKREFGSESAARAYIDGYLAGARALALV